MRSFVLFSVILISGCGSGSTQTDNISVPDAQTAITNVNIITMENEEVLENQTLLIKDGRFVAMGNASNVTVPENAKTIDGSGKYLIPGLAEMHAHIPGNDDMEYLEEVLFLYLSNGVTTIRGMLGRPYHLELRDLASKNEILSPRIYTSSPSLNGNSVKTIEDANEMVTAFQEAGYDFLKLHPGITLENFNEIIRNANEVGIQFSGHVSIDVGIGRALEAKYSSIDHIDGYLEGLVPADAGVDPTDNGFFGFNFTDIADESLLPDLVSATKEANVWVVPTQCLSERWAGSIAPEDLASEPEMKYIPRGTLNDWVKRSREFRNSPDYSVDRANKFNQIRRNIIKALHDGGVGLALGSDAPQVFNVPGFSIQHELGYMVQSGLTPYEALKAGTVNPAIFFEKSGDFGVIAVDASADFILLNSNPLEDIGHVRDNAGVMVRGRWLPEEEIQSRLEQIAEKYKE